MLEIFKEFVFYAAHQVACFGQNHKCNRLHGHSYHLTVFAETSVDNPYEFGKLEADCLKVIQMLDHNYLNDLKDHLGGEPTTERLACWILRELRNASHPVTRLTLKETNSSGVVAS